MVTYNRKALLVQCLDALQRQTRAIDRIVVVDNASSDGTAAVVRADFPGVDLLVLDENRGGAGGFHVGMKAAAEGGADWIWVMDDDAEPAPDALEALMQASGKDVPGVVALASQKIDARTGRVQRGHAGHYSVATLQARPLSEDNVRDGACPITFSSFVGLLVSRHALRRVGLPEAGFFIWGDDAEYSLRLASVGRMLLVPESRIHHHNAHAQSRRTGRARPLSSYWRHYYSLRNRILLANRHATSLAEWGLAYTYAVARLLQSAGAVLAWDCHKAARLLLLSRAFLHGVQNKTGAYVRPDAFPNPIGDPHALQPFDPRAGTMSGRSENERSKGAGDVSEVNRLEGHGTDAACPDAERLQVLVLVAHYRNADEVNRFLEQIRQQWEAAAVCGRAVVVDNSGGFSLQGTARDVATTTRPQTNLGYLNGCAWGRDHVLNPEESVDAYGPRAPTWTWVCNTDLVFGETFWTRLQAIDWPGDGCVLAPSIQTDAGDAQNPFMRSRPTAASIRRHRWVFSNAVTARLYRRAAEWKRRRRRGSRESGAVGRKEAIYAPHGSCMGMHRRFFERGGTLAYPAFMYTEEIHIAEQVRRTGGRVYWMPGLRVCHTAGGTTAAVDDERRRHWQRNSLDAVYRRYFSQ